MDKKNLTVSETLLLGCSLFSMHFGGACMLYPLTWGKESGSSVYVVYITIVLSALLLPMLAYIALARGKGDFVAITERILPNLGKPFCMVVVAIMGPLYVNPRMSAAAWAAVAQLFDFKGESLLFVIIFNVVYYSIVYWFLISRDKTAERIGRMLFPVLAVVVLIVIINGITEPISHTMVDQSFSQSPLIYGFLQGYATGDLPAALMFGMVIYQSIKSKNVAERRINANIVKVGFIGLGMLALTHLGHMIVGAKTGGTIDLTLSALYTEVVLSLMGRTGGIIFCVALVFASITSVIGLSASTAEVFIRVYADKKTVNSSEKAQEIKTYRYVAMATVVIGAIISSLGLNNVIAFFGPLLDACYPMTIVMVMYYVLVPDVMKLRFIRGARFAMISTLLVCLIDIIASYCALLGIECDGLNTVYSYVPLAGEKLAWVYIAAGAFIVGTASYKVKQISNAKRVEGAK